MVGFKFLVLVAVLATVTLTYGKRAKKGGANMDMFKGVGGAMACESKDEFNECKDSCYDDRECNDVANLNCGIKCKTACSKVDKLGKCKAAMLYEILDLRGRLKKGKHGGKKGRKGRR